MIWNPITDKSKFITASSGSPKSLPFSCWLNFSYKHTDSYIYDEYDWDSRVEIKYAINIQYSNAEYFNMAVKVSYIYPNLGDLNGVGGWNVLDIVTLANCVLANNCGD